MVKSDDEDSRWLQGQIRPEPRRPPQPIGDVISRLLSRRGYAHVQAAHEWDAAWREAAGELSRRTRPGKYARGVLEVIVENSATLQELTFQKRKLLSTLVQLAPQFKLKDLRFKVGEIA